MARWFSQSTIITTLSVRYAFAPHMPENGPSLREQQEMFGHKRITTVDLQCGVDCQNLLPILLNRLVHLQHRRRAIYQIARRITSHPALIRKQPGGFAAHHASG